MSYHDDIRKTCFERSRKERRKGVHISLLYLVMLIVSLIVIEQSLSYVEKLYLGRIEQKWHLLHMQTAMVQASLHICAIWSKPSLFTHTSSRSRGIFSQKVRSLASLNGVACAFKISYYGMSKDKFSLDVAHLQYMFRK